MYTSIEYVIVHKVNIYEVNRFGHKWYTQTLIFKLPEDKSRSTYFKPEFCVDGILLIE